MMGVIQLVGQRMSLNTVGESTAKEMPQLKVAISQIFDGLGIRIHAFFIRNFLKVSSSENFLILYTNSVQKNSQRLFKIGQISRHEHEKLTKICYPILSFRVST